MQRVEKMRHLLIAVSLLISSPALAADIRSECKQMREMGETHISKWFELNRKFEATKKWNDQFGDPAFDKCQKEFRYKFDRSKYQRFQDDPKYINCLEQELDNAEAPPPPEIATFKPDRDYLVADYKLATVYNAFCKR
jgi:hypothetical protein